MFRSVRFYSVSSPWPDSEQELSEKLHNTVFRPCGAYTEMSSGFEAPAGSAEAPLARRVGGADIMQLRSQQRVLPMAAVNEALEVRLEEYRQRMQEEPGRRTKRKLKEQTRDELLPKALLKSDRTVAVYIIQENVLAIGTSSEGRAERFMESLRAALGKLDVKPLAFSRPIDHVLMRIFADDAPPQFALGREARMRDRSEVKSTVRWNDVDLTQATVRKCLKDGMELTHLGFEFGAALSGVLDTSGGIGKLKLLGLEEPGDDGEEDPLARFDAELALLGGTLRQLIVSLRRALDE
jgi:recombination associated protein RdgC